MSKSKVRSIHYNRRLPVIAAADRIRRPKRPTPSNPLILSASELRNFLRCRVKWAWSNILRLRSVEPSLPLQFGSAGHKVLERYYGLERRTLKGMRRVINKTLMELTTEELPTEQYELLKAMCLGYHSWSKGRDREIKMQRLEPEKWFDLPLTPDGSIRVRGKIDVVFRARYLKKAMGAFEHKFKGQIKMDALDINLQLSVYLWALRKLYPEAKRYVAWYNVLRKQMPGPRVKADLFAREAVEREGEDIDQWELDTQRAAMDMLDAAIYPNPMDACSWDCDFQVPCLLRGRPDDLRHVMETHFTQR